MRIWVSIAFLSFLVGLWWLFFIPQETVHDHRNSEPQVVESINEPAVSIKQITLHEYSKKRNYELILTAQESVFNHRIETVTCQDVACTVLKNSVNIGAWHAQQSVIDRANKTITCIGPIHGRFQDVTFQGNDMVYNFADQTVQILGGVKTEFLKN